MTNKRNTLLLLLLTYLISSLTLASAPLNVDHSGFDRLLKKYVNDKGMVNYKGFKKDEKEFDAYLDLLSKNPPTDQWSKNDQVAFWINAYNAYTIRLILDHYPVKSIKDIGSKIKIPFVTTPWAKKFIKMGGETISLDNIEHGTLRKKFTEPRIHFALVCAAVSCPKLRNEAFVGNRLDAQLNDQGVDFMNDPTKNVVGADKAKLSKILDWYGDDFEKNGNTLEAWINKYVKVKMTDDTKRSYFDYNWALNEQ
ncbi:MAG: DUF547 domain-containing protein [Cytophagales bacterium]|nr:MAG: DUF547 domain-containing protein [Cytophagales bacterium]